jgi:hypothetical protein
MNALELFDVWAPEGAPWSLWAKPVLFAAQSPVPAFASQDWQAARAVTRGRWTPAALAETMLVLDLPGPVALALALDCASHGWRPFPMFHSCTGPSALVDNESIRAGLAEGALLLRDANLPETAPPAFVLDSRRVDGAPAPRRFDNRWVVFPQDFPSAARLLASDLRRVLLVQDGRREPRPDLAHVLLRWQRAGLEILALDLAGARARADRGARAEPFPRPRLPRPHRARPAQEQRRRLRRTHPDAPPGRRVRLFAWRLRAARARRCERFCRSRASLFAVGAERSVITMGGTAWTSVALACAALGGVLGELAFGPEPGTELERHWSERLRLEVDSLEETLGGNPVQFPSNQIEFDERRAFELVDELAKSEGGRPVDLTRHFSASSLALTLQLDDQSLGRVEGRDSCGKSVVRFVFEPEEERYVQKCVEGGLDDERLERLEPDLDLLEFLPAGEVEADTSWELDPEILRRFFSAGGDLGFQPTEMVPEMPGVPREVLAAGALGSLHELFGPDGELSGKVKGTYAGKQKEEGGEEVGELARLEFELDLEIHADLGERFRSFVDESATASTHALRAEAEVEGRLVVLWDLARRHLRSARFEGDVNLAGHVVFPVQFVQGQEPLEFVGDYELSGEAEVELVIE